MPSDQTPRCFGLVDDRGDDGRGHDPDQERPPDLPGDQGRREQRARSRKIADRPRRAGSVELIVTTVARSAGVDDDRPRSPGRSRR